MKEQFLLVLLSALLLISSFPQPTTRGQSPAKKQGNGGAANNPVTSDLVRECRQKWNNYCREHRQDCHNVRKLLLTTRRLIANGEISARTFAPVAEVGGDPQAFFEAFVEAVNNGDVTALFDLSEDFFASRCPDPEHCPPPTPAEVVILIRFYNGLPTALKQAIADTFFFGITNPIRWANEKNQNIELVIFLDNFGAIEEGFCFTCLFAGQCEPSS